MIVVFGSLNVDLVFPVPVLPASGETVLGESYTVVPGGKGANQALAAARDGARVVMVGAVGRDGFASVALSALDEAGVDLAHVAGVAAPTGCAAIAVDAAGANQIVVAGGANLAVEVATLPDRLLTSSTTLVLQMELRAATVAAAIARAKARGARVILNLAPALALPREALAAVDLLIVNEHEAATLGRAEGVDEAPAALARALGIDVVATLGAAGAIAIHRGDEIRVPALKIDPVDTTAAGDAFVGVLAAALDRGAEMRLALRRASIAGALACLKPGAQPSLPTQAEIDARLGDLPAA